MKTIIDKDGNFIYDELQLLNSIELKCGEEVSNYIDNLLREKEDNKGIRNRELEMIIDGLTYALLDIREIINNNDIYEKTKSKYKADVLDKIIEIIENNL